ncbi:malto-oligosyltrehalose synthase [soil metagenome]
MPNATFRLQLATDFGFDAAAGVVPYLAELGISHLYASPFLAARPGSKHGYDIVDYDRIDDELGGRAGFERMVAALREHGLGLILDFVPNHMGVGGAENAWWADVLEWGEASAHASDFDIDWSPAERSLDGKVLLPFLGDHYGNVLERGELRLELDATGAFYAAYYHHRFPIAVRDYAALLRETGDEVLRELAARFDALHRPGAPQPSFETRELARELKAQLARIAEQPAQAASLQAVLDAYAGNPANPQTFHKLHDLLERQFYRLAFWRVATQEINYRRFFDINDLAGLRIEDQSLFQRIHRLVLRLIAEGKLDGLRIDHVDGLYDPAGYCAHLREEMDRAVTGAAERDRRPYLVVEKILAPHELLRDWPVDGTTGYEFMNGVQGLFVNADAEVALSRTYRRFSGETDDFVTMATSAKREVLLSNLASELNVLSNLLKRIARRSWRSRDFTLAELRTALVAIIAHLPVYRTYVTARGVEDEDARYLEWAVTQARRDHPQLEGSLFRFVDSALRANLPDRTSDEFLPQEVLRFAMKSQQLSGAVAAKGVEDTAFYRYNRLISLNEVGGDPARFGISPAAFHHMNQQRREAHPHALLTTASHDHKRGEDTRLRISAISELSEEWRRLVFLWTRLNRGKRREIDGWPAPGRNVEYLFYQTLVGIWPSDAPAAADDELTDRLVAYMQKAVREAKRRSSWIAPNEDYEAAVEGFVRGVLDPTYSRAFYASFTPFAGRVARIAAANGLSQTLLKLTSPGVPDLYQGTEYWDLSLVDPDNRRPVEFVALRRSLESGAGWQDLAARWRTGEIKQRLIMHCLELRRHDPALFTTGRYLPLAAGGERAGHVVAFLRSDGGTAALVIAVCLNGTLLEPGGSLRLNHAQWSDSRIELPSGLTAGRYTNVLTGAHLDLTTGSEPVARLLNGWPVALWSRSDE